MAKARISLPFGLERNNGEAVTETTEIDHKGQPLDKVIDGIGVPGFSIVDGKMCITFNEE